MMIFEGTPEGKVNVYFYKKQYQKKYGIDAYLHKRQGYVLLFGLTDAKRFFKNWNSGVESGYTYQERPAIEALKKYLNFR